MSLAIRAARAAMEEENGFYGDYEMGDPGISLGGIIKGIGRGIGKVGKVAFKGAKKLAPFAGLAIPAVGLGLAGLSALRRRRPQAGPGLAGPLILPPAPLGFGPGEEMQDILPLPGTGIQMQLPRGPFGMGGGGVQVGRFQGQVPATRPVGRPGTPTGMQVCGPITGFATAPRIRNSHLNKSGYFRATQAVAATGPLWIAPGSTCVPNRKMNPLNPRALSRAVRRVMAAKRASKLINRISVRPARPMGRPRARASSCVVCRKKA